MSRAVKSSGSRISFISRLFLRPGREPKLHQIAHCWASSFHGTLGNKGLPTRNCTFSGLCSSDGRLRKATEGYGRPRKAMDAYLRKPPADPALTMTGPPVQRLLNPPVSRISCISRLLCSRLSLLCALCFLLFKAFQT